nr:MULTISPECIES: NUDIX hydrolase [Burkholderia]
MRTTNTMVTTSVKAIIRSGNAVLFLRNPRGEWELPGGRPESGESLEAALRREVLEECALTITSMRYAGSRSCEVVPGGHVLIVCFRCEFDGHAIAISDEHDRFGWIDARAPKPGNLPAFYWAFCIDGEPGE